MNLASIITFLCFFMFLSSKLPDKDYSEHEKQVNRILGHATIRVPEYDLKPLKEAYDNPATYAPIEKEANKLLGTTTEQW